MSDEGENLPRTRSPESGFTDFVQYQGDGEEETERTSNPHPALKAGRGSSGLCQTKPLDKPVMQGCLEHFQQFLSRLITLYIIPGHEKVEAQQMGALVLEGSQSSVEQTEPSESMLVQIECTDAFTAACQLFLECSSFPVYIAEGNLKPSPSQEQFSEYKLCAKYPNSLFLFFFTQLFLSPLLSPDTDNEQVCLPVWLQNLMDACCLASDFSFQGVAISLLMDLVGLTQSVAMVTAESVASGGSSEFAQPMSPSQGRVAVVIRPPLTQGILKYIADKTNFFKVSF